MILSNSILSRLMQCRACWRVSQLYPFKRDKRHELRYLMWQNVYFYMFYNYFCALKYVVHHHALCIPLGLDVVCEYMWVTLFTVVTFLEIVAMVMQFLRPLSDTSRECVEEQLWPVVHGVV